jgi:hypothetical protein
VLGVLADHTHDAAAVDDLALVTNLFTDARTFIVPFPFKQQLSPFDRKTAGKRRAMLL